MGSGINTNGMSKKFVGLRRAVLCVGMVWAAMTPALASKLSVPVGVSGTGASPVAVRSVPADTVAAYCDTLRVALDSAGQARVDRAIDAAVDAAVDSAVDKAVVKAVGESKAHKFFSDLWNQFGFGIDARVDLQLVQNRADENDVQFNIPSLKLVFDGRVLPQVRYYVKLRLTSSSGTYRDNAGSALNKAWVAVDIKNFSLTVGRQDLLFAAWEYDQNYADMYVATVINDKIDGVGTGVSLDYRFYNQHVAFQVINSSPVNFTDTRNSFAWTLRYVGDFFNGLFQPGVSVTLFNNAVRHDLFFVTGGLKFQKGPWKATLDYYTGRYIETTTFHYPNLGVDTVLNHYVADQSAALNVEYRFHPRWNAILKGTFDYRYDTELRESMFARYGVSAAIEYMPFARLPLRAHLAFMYRYYDYKPAWVGLLLGKRHVDEYAVYLGVRWYFQIK